MKGLRRFLGGLVVSIPMWVLFVVIAHTQGLRVACETFVIVFFATGFIFLCIWIGMSLIMKEDK